MSISPVNDSDHNYLSIDSYKGESSDCYIEKFERALSLILEYSFWKGTEIIYFSWNFNYPCSDALPDKIKKVANLALPILRLGGSLIGIGWCLPSVLIYLLVELARAPLSLIPHRGFGYLPGKKAPTNVPPPKMRLCALNACMLSGALPALFGGLSPAISRVQSLASFIKDDDGCVPDLLFLCEVGRTVERSLVKELENDYSHFFLGAGLSGLQESGLFVASNCGFTEPPRFKQYKTKGLSFQSLYNRGFFVFKNKEGKLHFYSSFARKAKRARSY